MMASLPTLPAELKVQILEATLHSDSRHRLDRAFFPIQAFRAILNIDQSLRECALTAMQNYRKWLKHHLRKLKMEHESIEEEYREQAEYFEGLPVFLPPRPERMQELDGLIIRAESIVGYCGTMITQYVGASPDRDYWMGGRGCPPVRLNESVKSKFWLEGSIPRAEMREEGGQGGCVEDDRTH
ncbi:MAG: hypothetical protein M1831_004026 [Alyxoria varia]|nr:MAG: hypothetical protein M1831_004026 [Alyxoria varia]